MTRAMLTVLLAVMWVSAVPTTAAAQSGPTKVAVSHSGEDSVGVSFAYQVREALRRSAGFEFVSRGEAYRIVLVSIDSSADRLGNASAVAVTFVIPSVRGYDIHLKSSVASVGRDRTTVMAERVLAILDEVIQDGP